MSASHETIAIARNVLFKSIPFRNDCTKLALLSEEYNLLTYSRAWLTIAARIVPIAENIAKERMSAAQLFSFAAEIEQRFVQYVERNAP